MFIRKLPWFVAGCVVSASVILLVNSLRSFEFEVRSLEVESSNLIKEKDKKRGDNLKPVLQLERKEWTIGRGTLVAEAMDVLTANGYAQTSNEKKTLSGSIVETRVFSRKDNRISIAFSVKKQANREVVSGLWLTKRDTVFCHVLRFTEEGFFEIGFGRITGNGED